MTRKSAAISLALLLIGMSAVASITTVGDKLGIGTAPLESLHLVGNLRFSGALMPNGDAGTAGQVLTSAGPGAAPTWAAPSAGGITGAGTNGAITFWTAASTISADASNLVWNNTDKRLGIGTSNAQFGSKLHIVDSTSAETVVLTTVPGNVQVGLWTTHPSFSKPAVAIYDGVLDLGSFKTLRSVPTTSAMAFYTRNAGNTVGIERLRITGGDPGDINIVNASLSLSGSAGTAGQVLTSSGPGAAPVWGAVGGGGATTVGALGAATANGASITGNTLNLSPASGSNPGVVTGGAQTFFGAKTINQSGFSLNLIDGNMSFRGTGGSSVIEFRDGVGNPRGSVFLDTTGQYYLGMGAAHIRLLNNTRIGANTAPTQPLDVTGNVQFSGALMPNAAAGTSGQVLTSAGAGAAPTWTTPASGGVTGSGTAPAFGMNALAFWTSTSSLSSSPLPTSTGLVWDPTNNRLGVAVTNNPTHTLHVQGTSRIDSTLQLNGDLKMGANSGTSGQVLTSAGAGLNPTWTTPSAGGITGTGANGAATFWTGASTISADAANYFWDNTNKRLGIGMTPGRTLDVTNSSNGSSPLGLTNSSAAGFAGVIFNNTAASGRGGIGYGNVSVADPLLQNKVFIQHVDTDFLFQRIVAGTPSNSASIANATGFWTFNNRIGIGVSPTQPLDVTGNVQFSGALMPNAAAGTSGQVLTSAGAGAPPTWTTLSGAGAGVTTMAAVGTSPNANAATITGNTLTLQPASATFPGVVTTDAQDFAGDKTFNNNIGIGTSPAQALDILGTTASAGVLANVTNASNTGFAGIRLNNDGFDSLTAASYGTGWAGFPFEYTGKQVIDSSSNLMIVANSFSLNTRSITPFPVITAATNSDITFHTNTLFATTSSGGRVGVGTTSPQATLDVAGTIRGTSNLTVNGLATYGATDSITAFAGGGQASATLLTKTVNFVTTVATAGNSVKLPVAALGAHVVIFNLSANSANVFPQTGSAIDALGTNGAFALPANTSKEFWGQATTQWRSR